MEFVAIGSLADCKLLYQGFSYFPGIIMLPGDFSGVLSARLCGCPQDCLSPRKCTDYLTSYVEMKQCRGGQLKKFYTKTWTKM